MTRYIATVNVPGYLPAGDDDEPWFFDTAAEAWACLASDREMDEAHFEPDEPEYSDTVDALRHAHEESADGCGTIYGSTPGYQGEHDLGLAYSVTAIDN